MVTECTAEGFLLVSDLFTAYTGEVFLLVLDLVSANTLEDV